MTVDIFTYCFQEFEEDSDSDEEPQSAFEEQKVEATGALFSSIHMSKPSLKAINEVFKYVLKFGCLNLLPFH